MVEVFLIISVVILAPIILFLAFMMLTYFGHPDDQNQAYFPKAVTVFGLWLAFASVMILPYDVSNSKGDGGGLRIDVLWQICYMAIAVFLSILIPFAFFYYENDTDPEKDNSCCESQFMEAVKSTGSFFIIFVFILVIMYAFLNTAEIPVHSIVVSSAVVWPASQNTFHPLNEGCVAANGCAEGDVTWDIPVTFPIYVMAFLAFFGWFFFTVFVGVGLVALPMDLVNEYRTRPKPMTPGQYKKDKTSLGNRAGRLIEIGEALQKDMDIVNPSKKEKKNVKETLKKFEAAYYFLKTDVEFLRISYKEKGGNPIWYFCKGFVGVIGGLISLTWIVHIAVFVLPAEPISPFLNTLFTDLEGLGGGGFPLFGILAYGLYAFWLIWAVLKGNFRLGARFLCIKLYPMELGNTLMNAFLFNTWIILLCSVPTVQFCVIAFPVYARFTSVDMLFGTQVQYLQFFRYFWENNVFVFAMLAFVFFTIVYMVIFPKDKNKEIQEMLDKVQHGSEDD